MATVAELLPGDLVLLGPDQAVHVVHTDHPLFDGLQLVVWRLSDGRWSHDVLDARQHVGDVKPTDAENRKARLRHALLGGVR